MRHSKGEILSSSGSKLTWFHCMPTRCLFLCIHALLLVCSLTSLADRAVFLFSGCHKIKARYHGLTSLQTSSAWCSCRLPPVGLRGAAVPPALAVTSAMARATRRQRHQHPSRRNLPAAGGLALPQLLWRVASLVAG